MILRRWLVEVLYELETPVVRVCISVEREKRGSRNV
jgi:hypothetical protein